MRILWFAVMNIMEAHILPGLAKSGRGAPSGNELVVGLCEQRSRQFIVFEVVAKAARNLTATGDHRKRNRTATDVQWDVLALEVTQEIGSQKVVEPRSEGLPGKMQFVRILLSGE